MRAAIVGSAFSAGLQGLEAFEVETPWGPHTLHRWNGGILSFRHGLPHRLLPHQINYRAQAWALRNCRATELLVTSSCGVLDDTVPLYRPLLVDDLVWLDQRLPDGSACTMWREPTPDQGHLVVGAGLFHPEVVARVRHLAGATMPAGAVRFWYSPGPRTKTPAENSLLASWGLQVNSMTLAPEVVLAAELGQPVAAVVVGHKASAPGAAELDLEAVARSLDAARKHTVDLVEAFLADPAPAATGADKLYRFGAS